MNICNYHINPVAVVVLIAGYALVMVMRHVLGQPIFRWLDLGILFVIVGLAFAYQARPEQLHYVTASRALVRLFLNYLYSFVVVCFEKLALPTVRVVIPPP